MLCEFTDARADGLGFGSGSGGERSAPEVLPGRTRTSDGGRKEMDTMDTEGF